ncbi:hypothetical protein jhhlp_002514 [Lomentospora prolificans]|uniref:4Fe-4S Mo/W bis-MGD-type domain-containing protein n=1 Tax=Lomentospora prolificans TaxID=41688 RepID=A0A2N3NED4_9PEZI|nr:hypothetical protein jhhlp_002514 [Lomentospora prolificans]
MTQLLHTVFQAAGTNIPGSPADTVNGCRSRDSIEDIWGPRTPYRHEWPTRVDHAYDEVPEKWVQSACVLCSNGCGLDIGVKGGKVVGVRGRATDRVNKGRLGPKGLNGWKAINSQDRLTHPLIRKNGRLERASWDEAMDLIVSKTKELAEHLTNHSIAFYTSGQLFLEEYYALALVGKAGLNTLHMDGNTRLCTASAAASMRESFGSDGQPGSYRDVDFTDCLFMVGHNVAATQTVLWSRILDRLDGPDPPSLIVVDPRLSDTARRATVHLSPKIGTNMALLNGIQHLMFKNGWINEEYVSRHVVGLDELRGVVETYNPEYVQDITGVPVKDLEKAAQILGTCKSLLSSALQGVYQSNQATASACQINNINLLRGLIGKQGSGILQMNGQPTAQNNREVGCDGEYPGFRNFQNPEHMQELARLWNIDPIKVPHWSEPTHVSTIMNFIKKGSIRMLWISGTNPLVSLPNLPNVREVLTQPELFVVCQDIYLTETAAISDVVLPAAQWAEKTGTFTNADRTVHISHKAVDPPGEARSDLDIFVDFATRMRFKDKDGNDLLPFRTPEEAFEAWKKISVGRPCDYSSLTYRKLTGGSGIQWPCNDEYPNGKERLFGDGKFFTDLDSCESYGHDLETGAPYSKLEYESMNPNGRAILKTCHYIEPREEPDEEYPLRLSTGRNVYQFHTRTKTGRTDLQKASSEPEARISAADAKKYGVTDGENVVIRSRRGAVEMKVRIARTKEGQVFIPFHYGYFDCKDGRARAANELTIGYWDPVSKQPTFKAGAIKIEKIRDSARKNGSIQNGNGPHVKEQQSAALERVSHNDAVATTSHKDLTNRERCLELWLGETYEAIVQLQEIYCELMPKIIYDPEIEGGLGVLERLAEDMRHKLEPQVDKYGENKQRGRHRAHVLRESLFPREDVPETPFEVLETLQGLHVYLFHIQGGMVALTPSSQALWDQEFEEAVANPPSPPSNLILSTIVPCLAITSGPRVLVHASSAEKLDCATDDGHASSYYELPLAPRRFEKSLYDLIRGLRNHKGNEREYIQNCLKECRSEIRSADMDLKATALLKLIYLEMVGHDMSWASFHVLEVMSSPKYHQKRVGYLGAAQSFRPDTEVLMLATNLLKKDLSSTTIPVMSLPITTLPHIITPSLALSVQTEMLTRLGHSHPNIRKKTIITLYRLALVYPETLLAAWPRIKDRLMDKDEDPSVTAAIVNVICELGWRRPHDFLPLAPRLFELLVDGGNNWMAIKLIKLFATLTPLEPRLVRKLLPPLTEIIRTTPAMSLLYECINGIIQGGILGSADDISGREEIASLCVDKLRSMILVDGDPNLKYVALLAFNKIVVTHPFLVSQQEDVILECIDSADITIRIKALDLVQGMVSSENLLSIVSRLMKQLRASQPSKQAQDHVTRQTGGWNGDSDSDANNDSPRESTSEALLPEDYRIDIIGRILVMCSQNNYSSIFDFDWYIDVLTQLVRLAPAPRTSDQDPYLPASRSSATDVAEMIGDELRNVAVKVKAMRGSAVRAADLIAQQLLQDTPHENPISSAALKSIAWILGEYATSLASPDNTLGSILQLIPRASSPTILITCVQAATKIFALIAGDQYQPWTAERKSTISLLMARVIDAFEPLTQHPNLEVQERSVEFVELLKLTLEAVSGHPSSTDDMQQDPPLLLTQAIPSLFAGWDLNSVAAGAQVNVPMPEGLNLDDPIHPNLERLLAEANLPQFQNEEDDEFSSYYYQKPAATSISSETVVPAIARLSDAPEEMASSYQQATEDSYLDADIVARRRAERIERNRDDPFYIGSSDISKPSTPIHRILQSTNGPDLDIDSIPIMQLDIDKLAADTSSTATRHSQPTAPRVRQQIIVAQDETLSGSGRSSPRAYDSEESSAKSARPSRGRSKNSSSILKVSSSGIGSLSLEAGAPTEDARAKDDEDMARAMKEVERLRLEMQRANERIQVAQGVDAEGTVVKKKVKKGTKKGTTTKKKKTATTEEGAGEAGPASGNGVEGGPEGNVIAGEGDDAVVVVKKKKKKAKPPVEIQD